MNHPENEVADIYIELRNQVLTLKPDAIGQTNLDPKDVLAVLMETRLYPEAVATLVAVVDGTASLYFSNGGGIIGGGEHKPVRAVCKDFIRMAQRFVPKMTSVSAYPLPKEDSVSCYVVTVGGVYAFEALEDDLGNERHPCSPLFHKGHELISAVREFIPE